MTVAPGPQATRPIVFVDAKADRGSRCGNTYIYTEVPGR
jgi:hypothetical protein